MYGIPYILVDILELLCQLSHSLETNYIDFHVEGANSIFLTFNAFH